MLNGTSNPRASKEVIVLIVWVVVAPHDDAEKLAEHDVNEGTQS